MRLHADMKQKAVVHAAQQTWITSPMPGVERRLLHRVGTEVAQATTLVRYAPGSHFSAHTHTGGEEFLVLEGVFQDEHGDYPAGTYIRNPPQSRHTPASALGCTIFVKLWQFDPVDRTHVIVQTEKMARVSDAHRPGVDVSPLYKDAREDVRIEEWAANTRIALELPQGGEFLVLQGGFADGDEAFATHSWLRLPSGSRLKVQTGEQGAKVWAKLHHLDAMPPPPAFMGPSLRLTFNPLTSQLKSCAAQDRAAGLVNGHIEFSHAQMSALFFQNGALNAAALERAIEWAEDRIQAAKMHLPAGAQLYTSEADLRTLASVSGVTQGSPQVLHVDAVEQTFSRLVMQSMGQAALQEALPASAQFFATVVFVRELMHHLHFSQIHILDDAEMAKLCA